MEGRGTLGGKVWKEEIVHCCTRLFCISFATNCWSSCFSAPVSLERSILDDSREEDGESILIVFEVVCGV